MLTKVDIGKLIRQIRIEKGKSQAELGEVLGHSHAAVSDIETGKTDVSASDLSVIAKFLEIPIGRLLEEPSSSTSFIQARDSKDITLSDKKELDESGNAFKKYVKNLAKKGAK